MVLVALMMERPVIAAEFSPMKRTATIRACRRSAAVTGSSSSSKALLERV